MPSLEEQVRELIREDPFLYEPLGRGLLNKAGVARWLIKEANLEGKEESITEAIREMEREEEVPTLESTYPLLSEAALEIRTDISALRLKRGKGFGNGLIRLLKRVDLDEGELFEWSPSEESGTVVLEDHRAEDAADIFDSALVTEPLTDLTYLRFVVPDDQSGLPLFGLLVEVLAKADIEIIAVCGDRKKPGLVIPTSDQRFAIRQLDSFGLRYR